MHPTRKIFLLCLFIFFFNSSFSQDLNGLEKSMKVTLADGTKTSLDLLKEGDKRLTIDAKNISIQICTVKSIKKRTTNDLLKIALADGNEIILTPNQLVLSYRGWTSYDKKESKKMKKYESFKIGNYRVNSFVYNFSPNAEIRILPIIEVTPLNESTEVYCIELDNPDAAFIVNNVFVAP